MGQLDGKVALVTGGGRGIGRAIALSMAEAGADVAIVEVGSLGSASTQYENAKVDGMEAARNVVSEVESLGRKAVAIHADVSKKEDTVRMVQETVSKLGALNVLICNAGIVNESTIEGLSEEAFDFVFAVNVKGVFLSCQQAIPAIRNSGGGNIINMSSIAGKSGVPRIAHYSASKYAVVGLTNALAKELAADNIRVNAICPGMLRTQMWEYAAEQLKEPGESKEEAWQRFVSAFIPLGRPQEPEDIGALAVYLATANNVTGQAINVDGGAESH